MSQLTRFLKQNRKTKENTTYDGVSAFTDENGVPMKWSVKPLSTREHENIRDECTAEVRGEDGSYRSKLDFNKYKAMVLAESIIEPNLNSQELLESYNAANPHILIREMIDDPGDYDKFADFVFKFNGFGNAKEKIEKAKN